MTSPDLQTVVIACPNCGTRYQVPYGTIGAAGRDVQCAQCTKPWHAMADRPPLHIVEDDLMFSPADENAMDAAFEAEAHSLGGAYGAPARRAPEHERTLAEIKATIMPRRPPVEPANEIDPALLSKSRRAFEHRQARLSKKLPSAQIRRTARLAALVALLSILVLGFALRTDLVRWFPALAGLYASIGLPVNTVGLEFGESQTLTSYRDGKAVMVISSTIRSVSGATVEVPPVLVTLLDQAGGSVYEWTVTPRATEMGPGETQEFSAELTRPPDGATRVRLSFTTIPGGTALAASAGTF